MRQSTMTVLMGLLISIALQFQPGKFDGLVQLGLQGFARREQGEVVGHPDVALGQLQQFDVLFALAGAQDEAERGWLRLPSVHAFPGSADTVPSGLCRRLQILRFSDQWQRGGAGGGGRKAGRCSSRGGRW